LARHRQPENDHKPHPDTHTSYVPNAAGPTRQPRELVHAIARPRFEHRWFTQLNAGRFTLTCTHAPESIATFTGSVDFSIPGLSHSWRGDFSGFHVLTEIESQNRSVELELQLFNQEE